MSASDSTTIDDGTSTRNAKGEWSPRVIGTGPVFSWPMRPKVLLRFMFGFPGYLWPDRVLYVALAVVTWAFLQPGTGIYSLDGDLTALATLQPGWMLLMYARNVALLLLVAGSWHLRLYYQRAQGTRFKYTSRWPATNNRAFLFGDQVKDNMFWSIASGATAWTLYEALMLWAYANGWLPWLELRSNPVWFMALFLLTPLWAELHFYIRPPTDPLEAALPQGTLPASSQCQRRALVGPGDAPDRAPSLLLSVDYLPRGAVTSHSLACRHAVHGDSAVEGPHRLRRDRGARRHQHADVDRFLLSLAASSLLRV